MAEFDYYIDNKITIWKRDLYTVNAENKVEADKIITDKFRENEDMEIEGVIKCDASEVLYDTEEQITVPENNHFSTMELYDDTGNMLADNTEA